jgi:transcriptional regulator with XRE-family HTH domain
METKSRSARRAHWQKLVEAQARSGLSLRVFAERLGVSPHTLAYWKYKRPVAGIDAAPKLLPVTVVDSFPPTATGITLEIDGARLTLPVDFDGESLARAIAVLRRPC